MGASIVAVSGRKERRCDAETHQGVECDALEDARVHGDELRVDDAGKVLVDVVKLGRGRDVTRHLPGQSHVEGHPRFGHGQRGASGAS